MTRVSHVKRKMAFTIPESVEKFRTPTSRVGPPHPPTPAIKDPSGLPPQPLHSNPLRTHPPIHSPHRPRRKARIPEQKHNRPRHLVRPPHPPQRRMARDLSHQLLAALLRLCQHRRIYHARGDGVDADAAGTGFARGGAGEADDLWGSQGECGGVWRGNEGSDGSEGSLVGGGNGGRVL